MVEFTERRKCIFHEFPFVLELLFILFTHKKLIDLHTSEGTFTFLLEKNVFQPVLALNSKKHQILF